MEFGGDATAEVDADRVCLVGYYRHRLVDRKDLAHLRSGDSSLGSGSDGGCSFAVLIRLVYDRHKTVVAREERAGYRFGKVFINGSVLRSAKNEGVVEIEDSQRDAVHACLGGRNATLASSRWCLV